MFKLHRLLLAGSLALIGSAAYADTYTPTHTFTAGTSIQSSQVNANFTAVGTVVNGNLDNANLKSGASIALTKLNLTQELPLLRSAAAACFSAGTTGDTAYRCSITADGFIKFGAGSATAQDMMLKREDANTLAVRNAGDSSYKILKCSVITPSTAIVTGVGGTGADLSAGTQGSVPYFSATGVIGSTLAPVASKLIGFNSGATALTTYNIAYGFGGSGADGALSVNTSSYTGKTQKNATTFQVNSGQTLTCDSSPVIINCTSTATITGTITMTAAGGAGGAALSSGDQTGWNGAGPGGGASATTDTNAFGGGGGGNGGAGGRGGNGSAATGRGGAGGSAAEWLKGGSGGGTGTGNSASTGANGGTGGSTLMICAVGAIVVEGTGVITASGTAGTAGGGTTTGGGGGGAGGNVYLYSQTSVNCQASSVVTASGGAGGASTGAFSGGGGGGGGGRREAWSPSNTFSGTTTVAAGSGGAGGGSGQAGENATAGSATAITGTPNFPLISWRHSAPGIAYMESAKLMHNALHGGEMELHQRALAREAAQGNLVEYAKYMSPDYEGTSAVCDAEGLANDRS